MPPPIEDYALIGDCETAGLVGRDGSIDWLCLPRFDSDSCFTALLGNQQNGHWLIAPEEAAQVSRRYKGDTLILETTFRTSSGSVVLVDFMPPEGDGCVVIRLVFGIVGRMRMRSRIIIRFDYGSTIPWVTRLDDGTLRAIAGPQMLLLKTPAALRGEDFTTVSEFTVEPGQRIPFVLRHASSYLPTPELPDPFAALHNTERFWAKPKWEFPRLCRGGSKSLTYPGVEAPRSIAATRLTAKRTKGIASMDGLKADTSDHGAHLCKRCRPSMEVRLEISC